MKDYRDNNAYTNNEAFPNTLAVDSSGAGNKDGTKFNKELVNDNWAFYQALLKEAGLQPNGQDDTVESSQKIEALKKIITSLANTSSSGSAIKKTTLRDIVFGNNDDLTFKDGISLPVVKATDGGDDYTAWKQEVDLLDMLSNQLGIDKSKLNIVDWNFQPYKYDNATLGTDIKGMLVVQNTVPFNFKQIIRMFSVGFIKIDGIADKQFKIFFQLCDENYPDINSINLLFPNSTLIATEKSAGAIAIIPDITKKIGGIDAYCHGYLYSEDEYPVQTYGFGKLPYYHINTQIFTGNKLKFGIYSDAINLQRAGYIRLNIDMRYQIIGD